MVKIISIVIPCFNESEVIDFTVAELIQVTTDIENNGFRQSNELKKHNEFEKHDTFEKKYAFELIFVNDGSRDDTEAKLQMHRQQHSNIRILSFSRNFGHQQAVTAGLDVSTGDAVVLIDADLQDPPQVIQAMIEQWEAGYDVVYGTRVCRAGESTFKRASAKLFYRLLNRLSEVPIPLDTGDFRLMDRQVVDQLIAMPEKARFIRGMVSWIGFSQTAVSYERSPRFAGESKYPLAKMLKFAIDGILSFSVKPLKLSIMMGFLSSGIAFVMLMYSIYVRLFTDGWVSGWTSVVVSVLFMGGVQLISVGILGEYVARIYNESKGRPLYILKKRRTGESTEDTRPSDALD